MRKRGSPVASCLTAGRSPVADDAISHGARLLAAVPVVDALDGPTAYPDSICLISSAPQHGTPAFAGPDASCGASSTRFGRSRTGRHRVFEDAIFGAFVRPSSVPTERTGVVAISPVGYRSEMLKAGAGGAVGLMLKLPLPR